MDFIILIYDIYKEIGHEGLFIVFLCIIILKSNIEIKY